LNFSRSSFEIVNIGLHNRGMLKYRGPIEDLMLGELIGEMQGKVSSQRVIDVKGPTMETSIMASGSLKDIQVTEALTYVANTTSKGILHGVGNGIITTLEGDVATYTGEGIGKFNDSAILKWRGAIFFEAGSDGKLGFLNGIVGVFEAQVDAGGNFSDKTWEWK
jgi:hypothetical protein